MMMVLVVVVITSVIMVSEEEEYDLSLVCLVACIRKRKYVCL